MAETTTQKFFDPAHFQVLNPEMKTLRVSGGALLSTQQKTLETTDCTQEKLEQAVAEYVFDPYWTDEGPTRRQLENALAAIQTELTNWPRALAQGANLLQVGQRVNLVAALVQRNTERLEWLTRMLLRKFD
jgi:hypothetical protein